jgi:hypothetical protein
MTKDEAGNWGNEGNDSSRERTDVKPSRQKGRAESQPGEVEEDKNCQGIISRENQKERHKRGI